MSKKKKRKKPNNSRQRKKERATGQYPKMMKEAPAAEAATVAWLLCLLATLAAVILALASRWLYWSNPTDQAGMASGVLTFTSIVTGVFTLALTFAVTRMRKNPPPTRLLQIAFVVGILPFIAWAGLVLAPF